MEQYMNFINITNVDDVTMDRTLGRNNLMITIVDSIGRTNVLVITPEKLIEMNLMVNEQLFLKDLNDGNN